MTTLSVLDAAREVPSRLALTDGAWQLTFSELAERVRERMRALAHLAQPAQRVTRLVAVATDEHPATLETLLALIELAIPFLPIHQRSTPSERAALLGALPVSHVLQPSAGGFALEERPFAESTLASALLSCAPHLAALATSGSTGRPRVALLGRAAFVASARASAEHLGWYEPDRWLLCLPLAHIGGLSVLTRCLLARRPIVLQPVRSAGNASGARLAAAIAAGAATLISVVPAQLDALLELQHFELPRAVRVMLTGGAAASPRLLGAAVDRGWPVLASYGLTEACSQVATQRPGSVNRGDLGVGVPLPGVGVSLEAGVIRIHGPTLASGYLGTGVEEVIRSERGFQTRDLGRIDEAGQLHVLGRVDDLIISGGENIIPGEVEAVLQSCSGVLEACVFAVPDARWGQLVGAGLRTRSGDVEALIAAVDREARQHLAAFKRPRFYVCSPDFSYNANGKLDRRRTTDELRARVESAPDRHRAPPG